MDFIANESLINDYFLKLDRLILMKLIDQNMEKERILNKILLKLLVIIVISQQVVFFVKCITFLVGKDYKQLFLDFIRVEKRKSNVMTKTRIQLF